MINQLKIENGELKVRLQEVENLNDLSRNLVEENAEMKAMLEQIQAQLGNK